VTSNRIREPWEIVGEAEVTPESILLSRRALLAAGVAGAASLALGRIARAEDAKPARNEKFTLDRPLTEESVADQYNNFYELTESKDVYKHVDELVTEPWKVEVAGLCAKPRTFDLDDLRKLDPEERLYRFRCVEAWAMAVPWDGFPLRKLLDKVEPKSEAKFVRFVSVLRPDQLPGQRASKYSWPYYEALRIDEAVNELAFVATGIYGHALSKQHGAPVRMVVPWKYGYKGAKSIVKIELVAEQPKTFWNDLQPTEYGFHSNVNPKRPHPRWSQASERMIGSGERRPTQLYNGYADLVKSLYPGDDPF
jgi:sulfoxide reductase catalytic subunit YedY